MSRFAVIMAGGSGTRFWPKSSSSNPKQFLKLTDPKRSMIQVTFDRLSPVVPATHRWVIGVKATQDLAKKQLKKITFLGEPIGRNTMAAACWSAWATSEKDKDATVALLPADAFIANEARYRERLVEAYDIAETKNRIVCLGIKPTFPATGYGYIETRSPLTGSSQPIHKFVEKPNRATAEHYLATGMHTWNAGIFVFKASTFKAEVKKHAPEFFEFFEKNKPGKKFESLYKNLPSVPLDIALMEKTDLGEVVLGDFGWNDVGSWPSLLDVNPTNHGANLIHGAKEVFTDNSEGNIVELAKDRFLALVGIRDLVIVETKDVLLLCHKDHAQNIKNVVEHVKSKKNLTKLV